MAQNADDLAKAIVEPLSEDEQVRGDLTDDGFGPLLQWAVDAATSYAEKALKANPHVTTDAMQPYAARLKNVLLEAVADADAAAIEDPKALLDFDHAPHVTITVFKDLALAKDDADGNAVKIAAVLEAALEKKEA